MLIINNLRLNRPKKLLNNCQLVIKSNQITGVLGKSGCGKTTLLYEIALLGYHQFDSYVFNDMNVHDLNDKDKNEFLRNHISLITQNIYLLDNLTVLETIKFYMMLNNVEWEDEYIYKLMDYVNLDVDLSTVVDNLSGGEKQRLYIACELLKDSQLYIFDEPFAYLDQNNIDILFEIIKKIAYEKNKMVIVSTHNYNIAHNFDSIYMIDNHNLSIIKNLENDYLINRFNNHLLSFKPLKYYANLYLKYNKFKVIMTSVLLSLLLTISLFISDFNNNFQKHYGESLIHLLNNEVNIIDANGKVIIPKQYDYVDKQLHNYNTFKSLETKDYNDVTLYAYLPDHFHEKDCYKEISDTAFVHDDYINGDIYVSYSLYRKMNDTYLYTFISNTFNTVINPSKVLFPSVEDKQAIYIPYDQYEELLKFNDFDISFMDVDSILVSIDSIEDISQIEKSLPVDYKILELDKLNMSIKATQFFNNKNILRIVIFIFIFILFYKAYEITTIKNDIILLKIQGIPNKMIILTKVYLEILGFILRVFISSLFVTFLFFVFSIFMISTILKSLINIIFYNVLIYMLSIALYAITINRITIINQSRKNI